MENFEVKKYVLTVMPDVAVGNGKDPAATELLEKMALYGKVTPLDSEVAALRAEYQTSFDNLMKQFLAIQDQALTEDEILFLNFYRERKAANGKVYEGRIATLESKIAEAIETAEKKAAQLRAILDGQ
jgi:hypothetical protein